MTRPNECCKAGPRCGNCPLKESDFYRVVGPMALAGADAEVALLRTKLALALAALDAAESLAMIHRANRMAGQPTPALDDYDQKRAALEAGK